MKLRGYQSDSIDALYNYFRSNTTGNPIVSACVGAGKSVIIGAFTKDVLTKYPHQRILMVTHVKELIEQNFEKLKAFWPQAPAGIVSASIGKKEFGNPITFAGIGSVYTKASKLQWVDLMIVDEAHLISTNEQSMYRKFIADLKVINPKLKVIGFTGTPFRGDQGLITDGENAIFDDICYNIGIGDLIELGYLMPLVSKQMDSEADLKGVRTVRGDFAKKDLQNAFDKHEVTQQALNEVEQYASNRRCGLFFCTGVEHAFHVRDALRERGYTAETITGDTPKGERADILKRFKAGEVRYLTNDSVLTTGTDIPMLDLIVLLRATKSTNLYVQILGRGVRCLGANASESRMNGKHNCMVLDYGGNIERHGPVDKIVIKPKKKGNGEDSISIMPTKICELCREPSPVFAKNCESCGAEFPEQEKPMHETVASTEAVLSKDIKPVRHEVTDIKWLRHKKKGKPDSLRVVYMNDLKEVAREWVCLWHGGWAQTVAERWWQQHVSSVLPTDIDNALARQVEHRKPKAVYVRKSTRNTKYKEIVSYE